MFKFPYKKTNQRLVWSLLGLLLVVCLGVYNFSPAKATNDPSVKSVPILSRASLIHLGSHDSFATTQDGIQGARLVLDFLKTGNTESAQAAIRIYDKIIPIENYGGEYTALQWFSQLLTMKEEERNKKLTDPLAAKFYEFFTADNFANLKEYLIRKYQLETFTDSDQEAGNNRKIFLEDFILFNNPRREEWEKTSKIIQLLNFQPGQTIVDIGSGPGYFSYRFAKMVGNKGKVFSVDTVQEHLNYLKKTSQELGLLNIETVNNDPGKTINLSVNKKVDVAFMCSLYHVIYAESREVDRASFIKSIYDALKPGGKFIVVDNALVADSELPYHGPYIAKELIIGQLQHYGFSLAAYDYPVPQRYVLIFEKVA